MRPVVFIVFLLGLGLCGVGEPEVWGFTEHEDADHELLIKENESVTIIVNDPSQVQGVFLSRDENCDRMTAPTIGLKHVPHGVVFKLPIDDNTRELTEHTLLHICTDVLVGFEYKRIVLFDSTREEDEGRKFIYIYVICICLSCLFSGLNLALLSLDVETLEMVKKYDDSPRLRRYAADIIPIRQNSNLMICTIILGNTLVNVASTVIFSMLTEPLELNRWAHLIVITICPTTILLLFGEILPQIVCTKYALPIGAHMKMVMQFFTFITFPLSKPLSWMLDFFVGREKLKSSALREIVRFAGKKHNMAMIANNTLELRKKLARDVMTPLTQVKTLSDADLVNGTLKQSIRRGHTRMPVCKAGDIHNIIGVLNVKDLLLLDESEFITVGTVLQLWPRESTCRFAPGDTPVGQLMMVLRSNVTMVIVTEYEMHELKNVATGIVTLEDLLEEIVGEIYDEKDWVKMTGDDKKTDKNKRKEKKEEKSGFVKNTKRESRRKHDRGARQHAEKRAIRRNRRLN